MNLIIKTPLIPKMFIGTLYIDPRQPPSLRALNPAGASLLVSSVSSSNHRYTGFYSSRYLTPPFIYLA